MVRKGVSRRKENKPWKVCTMCLSIKLVPTPAGWWWLGLNTCRLLPALFPPVLPEQMLADNVPRYYQTTCHIIIPNTLITIVWILRNRIVCGSSNLPPPTDILLTFQHACAQLTLYPLALWPLSGNCVGPLWNCKHGHWCPTFRKLQKLVRYGESALMHE